MSLSPSSFFILKSLCRMRILILTFFVWKLRCEKDKVCKDYSALFSMTLRLIINNVSSNKLIGEQNHCAWAAPTSLNHLISDQIKPIMFTFINELSWEHLRLLLRFLMSRMLATRGSGCAPCVTACLHHHDVSLSSICCNNSQKWA